MGRRRLRRHLRRPALSSGSFGSDRRRPLLCTRDGRVRVASIACAAAPSLEVLLGARPSRESRPPCCCLFAGADQRRVRRCGRAGPAISIWRRSAAARSLPARCWAACPPIGSTRARSSSSRPDRDRRCARDPRRAAVPAPPGPAGPAGQLAAVVAVAALTFAVIEGGHEGWLAPGARRRGGRTVIALAFVAIERGSSHPAVPFSLFRCRCSRAPSRSASSSISPSSARCPCSASSSSRCWGRARSKRSDVPPLTALITAVNILAGRVTAVHGRGHPC